MLPPLTSNRTTSVHSWKTHRFWCTRSWIHINKANCNHLQRQFPQMGKSGDKIIETFNLNERREPALAYLLQIALSATAARQRPLPCDTVCVKAFLQWAAHDPPIDNQPQTWWRKRSNNRSSIVVWQTLSAKRAANPFDGWWMSLVSVLTKCFTPHLI